MGGRDAGITNVVYVVEILGSCSLVKFFVFRVAVPENNYMILTSGYAHGLTSPKDQSQTYQQWRF